jgi:hypothetical protein
MGSHTDDGEKIESRQDLTIRPAVVNKKADENEVNKETGEEQERNILFKSGQKKKSKGIEKGNPGNVIKFLG